MDNLRDNKPENFNLFVRGSKSRLGREIVKYFMLKNSSSTVVEISRFGGSFAYVINDISIANVFFITNGKTTNTSSKQDCEFETQKLYQLFYFYYFYLFHLFHLQLNGKKYKVQIWDTAGQERYKTMTQSYYRQCKGVLLVYDITNRMSFENVINLMSQNKKNI